MEQGSYPLPRASSHKVRIGKIADEKRHRDKGCVDSEAPAGRRAVTDQQWLAWGRGPCSPFIFTLGGLRIGQEGD